MRSLILIENAEEEYAAKLFAGKKKSKGWKYRIQSLEIPGKPDGQLVRYSDVFGLWAFLAGSDFK